MFVLTFSTNNKATYTLLKGESRGKFSRAFFSTSYEDRLCSFARFVLFLFQTDVGVYEHLKIITNN